MSIFRILCGSIFCVTAVYFAAYATKTESNKTMNMTPKTGSFSCKDTQGNQILFQWDSIDGKSPELTQKIRQVSPLLINAYTQQELQFARKYPEAIPTEHFLKSLAPLFEKGAEAVDWHVVKEQITAIFNNFFTTTDFAQFSAEGEQHIFVVAKDATTDATLGVIQFLSNHAYSQGSIKAGMFGLAPDAQGRGLDKILMASIFKLKPDVTRIFVHTRATNENELVAYEAWGFAHEFKGHWVNSEYLTEKHKELQNIAENMSL